MTKVNKFFIDIYSGIVVAFEIIQKNRGFSRGYGVWHVKGGGAHRCRLGSKSIWF